MHNWSMEGEQNRTTFSVQERVGVNGQPCTGIDRAHPINPGFPASSKWCTMSAQARPWGTGDHNFDRNSTIYCYKCVSRHKALTSGPTWISGDNLRLGNWFNSCWGCKEIRTAFITKRGSREHCGVQKLGQLQNSWSSVTDLTQYRIDENANTRLSTPRLKYGVPKINTYQLSSYLRP